MADILFLIAIFLFSVMLEDLSSCCIFVAILEGCLLDIYASRCATLWISRDMCRGQIFMLLEDH